MTDDDILKVARECGYDSGETVEMNDVGLITFAKRIAAMQRSIDAGIVFKTVVHLGDASKCAEAIRGQSDE